MHSAQKPLANLNSGKEVPNLGKLVLVMNGMDVPFLLARIFSTTFALVAENILIYMYVVYTAHSTYICIDYMFNYICISLTTKVANEI